MLYDPKWEKKIETKTDPFSLHTLIAWLEKQPPDTEYCFTSVGHCLIAQYLNASGIHTINVNPDGFFLGYEQYPFIALPSTFNDIANGRGGANTFGAALDRARASAAATMTAQHENQNSNLS